MALFITDFYQCEASPWTFESADCLQVKCNSVGIEFVVLAAYRHWQSNVIVLGDINY